MKAVAPLLLALLLSIPFAFAQGGESPVPQQSNPNPAVFVTLDGNPVAGAHVTFTSRNQFVQSVTTGPDGKAQLTNALLGGVTPVEYNCTIPTTGIGAANNPITPAFFYNATLVMNPYTVFYCRFYSVIQGSSENNAAFLASGVMGSAMLLSLTIVYAKRLQAKRKKGGRYA